MGHRFGYSFSHFISFFEKQYVYLFVSVFLMDIFDNYSKSSLQKIRER